jgi:hypothetical protein
LKCVAGEGWRRSVSPTAWEVEKYYIQSRRRGISYVQYKEGRLTGLVTSCVGTAFLNTCLKEWYKRRKYEEEDVNSCWMTLRKRELLERGSPRSHCVENSLWKRLWTCRKADCGIN